LDALPQSATGLTGALDEPASATLTAFPDSGYYILAHEGGRLIADFGGPGESPNPGHQHAGIFSFEVSLGGRRVVVDSGTPSYESDEERQRARGTSAHNTVRIDGTDQYELWKAFRVGRRAKVGEVRREGKDDYACIAACHDGYHRLGVEHRRTIAVLGGSGWVVIDWFRGIGRHRIESFLHLHPEIEIVPVGGAVTLPAIGHSLIDLTAGHFEIRDDWYSPRLGQRIPSRTLLRSEEVTFAPHRTTILWAYGLLASPATGECIAHADHDLIAITTPGVRWTIAAGTDGLLRITRNRA
jgi:hypothetical protein